jgi:hypothetical protein
MICGFLMDFAYRAQWGLGNILKILNFGVPKLMT